MSLSIRTLETLKDCLAPWVKAGQISPEDSKEIMNCIARGQKGKEAKAALDMITRKRVAEITKLSIRTIDRLSEDGTLPKFKIGKRSVRYRLPDVMRLTGFEN